jgi:hypothetical protein
VRNSVVFELENKIKMLEQKLENQQRQHENDVNYYKSQISSLRRRLFGSKSERTKAILPDNAPVQLSLFDEAEQEAT